MTATTNQATRLRIDQINTAGGTQMRAGLVQSVVDDYHTVLLGTAEAWPFPPIVVYYDGSAYHLADGFHRLAAARRAYMTTVIADIRPGTRRDAILHAAGANAHHGLQRSAGDKRRAIAALLADEEWRAWSDREIARRCHVSPTLVGDIRKEQPALTVHVDSDPAPITRTYVTKHGTEAQMAVSNIGKPAAAYASDAPAIVRTSEHTAPPAAVRTTPPAAAFAPILRLAPVSQQIDYDGDEWYTPSDLMESARYILTGAPHKAIGLDPASSNDAQKIVLAQRHFTKADSGLDAEWHSDTVWLNPPYSSPAPWVEKLLAEFDAKHFQTALLLVNNATDTVWFHQLLDHPRVVPAFLRKRLVFWRQNYAESTTARQGQVLVFVGNRLGPAYKRFHQHVTDRWGHVLWPVGKLEEGA